MFTRELQSQSVKDRNPDVIIFAFVLASIQPRNPPTVRRVFFHKNTSKMSGSSNIIAMKKVVKQLRFEASINRVKVINVFSVFLVGNLNRYPDLLTRLACARR